MTHDITTGVIFVHARLLRWEINTNNFLIASEHWKIIYLGSNEQLSSSWTKTSSKCKIFCNFNDVSFYCSGLCASRTASWCHLRPCLYWRGCWHRPASPSLRRPTSSWLIFGTSPLFSLIFSSLLFWLWSSVSVKGSCQKRTRSPNGMLSQKKLKRYRSLGFPRPEPVWPGKSTISRSSCSPSCVPCWWSRSSLSACHFFDFYFHYVPFCRIGLCQTLMWYPQQPFFL